MTDFELISGDRRRVIFRDWSSWLKEATKLNSQIAARIGISPFYFHEQAVVGHLVNSAGRLKLHTLSEYQLTKRSKEDLRKGIPGRADLWLDFGERCYSFEFKAAWHQSTPSKLSAVFDLARSDANCIRRDECDFRIAAMTAYVEVDHDPSMYEEFAKDVDFCFRIGGVKTDGAYFFAEAFS